MRRIPWKLVLKTALVPAPQGQAAHEANMGKELWFQPPTALEHRHIWQHRHSWPPSPPHAVDNCCGPAKWEAHALSSVSCTHCPPTKLPICAGIRADESPTGQCPMVGIFQRCQERKYIFCGYRDFAIISSSLEEIKILVRNLVWILAPSYYLDEAYDSNSRFWLPPALHRNPEP